MPFAAAGRPCVRTRSPASQPTARRKCGGISARWPIRVSSSWGKRTAAKISRIAAPRAATTSQRQPRLEGAMAGSVLAVDADAVKLHPVIDQAVTQLLGDLALQRFELGIDELYHLAAFYVD